jgi:hypothetical protein
VPLPWNGVNARESQSVAQLIGLPRRETGEKRKWGCPFCGSSDALHAYAGPAAGFGCWAACGADRPKGCRGYSNIDVAGQHWDVSPVEACKRLAAELGIVYDDDHCSGRGAAGRGPRATPPRPERPPSEQERNLAALRQIPGARLPPVVYADVIARLRLTFRGARYLAGRRLDAAAARKFGYRSIDDAAGWESLAKHLSLAYTREELAAAGFPLAEDGDLPITLPFNGRLPALVIPFHRRGRLISVRFRNVLPDNPLYKHNRYRNLTGVKPFWPYNADALRGSTVHLCEGELDAETLRQQGENAAGLFSAGIWLDHWTAELAAASEIVDWHDCRDEKRAGDLGAEALRTRLGAAFGEAWIAQRWRRMITDADPNALHRRSRLVRILRARPWRDVSTPEVHVA